MNHKNYKAYRKSKEKAEQNLMFQKKSELTVKVNGCEAIDILAKNGVVLKTIYVGEDEFAIKLT